MGLINGKVAILTGPVLFLASPLSNYVSGIVLEVTGAEQFKTLRD